MSRRELLTAADIDATIKNLGERVLEETDDLGNFAIVGIQTRGVILAERIRKYIEDKSGQKVNFGTLDSTFYRDDLATRGVLPVIKETHIEFNISKKKVLLVDDVIFTGRTTKAALETIMAFGRPSAIRLLVLVDRGNRELPMQPDYCGFKVETEVSDSVKVRLKDVDNEDDKVVLLTGDDALKE